VVPTMRVGTCVLNSRPTGDLGESIGPGLDVRARRAHFGVGIAPKFAAPDPRGQRFTTPKTFSPPLPRRLDTPHRPRTRSHPSL